MRATRSEFSSTLLPSLTHLLTTRKQKIFAFLVITPFPIFLTRLYMRITFLDIMCTISLIISAAGIPAVRTDSLVVILPGPWKTFFIRLNIYIAAVIALHVILWPPRHSWDFNGGESLWVDDLKHFGLLPLGICFPPPPFKEVGYTPPYCG